MKAKYFISSALIGFAALLPMAPAMAQSTIIAQPAPAACLSLGLNLRFGHSDASTGGAVSALQNYLSAQGYFNSAYLGSGRFGSITMRAVMQYQAAHGIPSTGYVGPLTRAAIANSCQPVVNNPVSLYSVNPSSGAVGTTISITGFGFTTDNTVLMDGLLAARSVPITSSIAIACTTNPACHGGINQTIQFSVPQNLTPNCPIGSLCPMFLRQVTAGQYKITVQNQNGTSNTILFTVPGNSSDQTLSIQGLDVPSTLTIGQIGTWTVRALAQTNSGNLHYSVVWGDEAQAMGSSIMAPQSTSVQSSASFTHVYRISGTYTPVFTVTDDFGHSTTASNSIVVQPVY